MIPFLFGALILLLVAGAQVGVALGIVAWLGAVGSGVPTVVVPQRFFTVLDSFPLISAPLFILAGGLMEYGGVSRRLVNFAMALVGPIKGSLGMVVLVSTTMMSGVSGSSTADTVAIGSVTISAMKKRGYPGGLATSIAAASGASASLVPPSIDMIILGSVVNISIAALFIAGLVPAIVNGLFVMGITYLFALRLGLATEPWMGLAGILNAGRAAFLPLVMPVIILGGILSGVFTPTEAAVVAVVYAFFLAAVVYRELKLGDLPKIAYFTVRTTGVVALVIAAASAFAWVLTALRIPQHLTALVVSVTTEPWQFLLLVNVLLLVLGTFLEAIPIIIIMGPILYPVAQSFGIDPIHFGIIIMANTGVGFIMPPMGVCLYAAMAISGLRLSKILGYLFPYILGLVASLMVITYVPAFSLWLPRLMIGK
jgi:C4-dicarboxylate transporter, DctM subunit